MMDTTPMRYLSNHEVLSSGDIDEVRDFVKTISAPHDFELNGKGAELGARFAIAQCGDVNLVHVTFGNVDIRVKSEEENTDEVLIYVVTSGSGTVQHGAKDMQATISKGFIRDTAMPVDASQKDLSTFMIPISKKKLKDHVNSLMGTEPDLMDISFNQEIDILTPGGAIVRNTIFYLAEALDGPLRGLNNPILNAQLEDMLLTQILTLLPNSYQDVLNGHPISTVVPYNIKRAREYIHAHADKKVGLAEIVAAAGCSYRAVQRGFLDAYGVSPMAYLRTVRLRRIRAMLLAGPGEGSISEIAQKMGFCHAGRFSQAYCREFGELPSETLRKRS
ncbi:MAG: AraC family transcriptional regulator [Alphaproteobacteria bacterium]|nr:AraC family transcriptional regulator [Alphaproteobacteria bacterium]